MAPLLRLPAGTDLFSDHTSPLGGGHHGVSNPTEREILEAFEALEQGWIEFVILEDDTTGAFIQAAGSADEGYVLQHNDGSADWQYQATNADLSGVAILDAFLRFHRGDPAWKTMFSWQKFKL
jgi:hypothetical protein